MTKKELEEKIIDKYRKEGCIFLYKSECDRAYCYLNSGLIIVDVNKIMNPTDTFIFDLLHEIGHIMSNKEGMKRWEEEASATEWAIKEAKKYNITISQNTRNRYDKYINDWITYARKHKSKNIPTKEYVCNW